MKINNVSIVWSTVRKLSGWSSIYHSMEHRVRPGKCLNRTNIINIIMLTSMKVLFSSFSWFIGVENIRPRVSVSSTGRRFVYESFNRDVQATPSCFGVL